MTFLILFAVGCMDQGLNPFAGIYGKGEVPEIKVSPQRLHFGELGYDERKTLEFSVENVGTEQSVLDVDRLWVESDEEFHLVDVEPFQLGYGQKRTVAVTFTSDDPELHEGQVTVESNDEGNPAVPVLLDAGGLMPQLVIDPDPYGFGSHMVGCDRTGTITLQNVGNDDLFISDIEEVSTAFTLVHAPELPLTLLPDESSEVRVQFAPPAVREYEGELVVTSNDPRGLRVAGQYGEGRSPNWYTDRFQLPLEPPVDILFYVDQSRSMADDQRALADNVASFITRLAEESPDWQIMVVTDDTGCSASGILTPETPAYVERFGAATRGGEGGGSFTEAGLTIVRNAVAQSAPGECNDGFLRPEAYFHAIMVSDEPEQSAEPWYVYVEGIQADAGGDLVEKVKLSAVAGDMPTGCNSDENSAEPASGYYESVIATNGVFLSLCSSWSRHVEALVDATVSRSTFELSNTPVPETIAVTVDGVAAIGIWEYDGGSNAVIFEPDFAPSSGSRVEIVYQEPIVCD